MPKKLENGIIADIRQFPYQVSLQKKGVHHCGGVILGLYHILSAAHCLTLTKNMIEQDVSIISGSNNLDDLFAGEYHEIILVIIHPEFDIEVSWKNDLAIFVVVYYYNYYKK